MRRVNQTNHGRTDINYSRKQLNQKKNQSSLNKHQQTEKIAHRNKQQDNQM